MRHTKNLLVVAGCLALLPAIGCGGKQRAVVSFDYVVQPSKGLPEGMKVLYIEPAKLGTTTDPKWSELSVAIMKELVNDSASSFGTKVVLSDRRDTQVTFQNADAKAAGMVTGDGTPEGGKLLDAQGAILSTINVMVDQRKGKKTTFDITSASGGGGHGSGWGGLDLTPRDVETVTRTMTVQCEFKLVDTANNRQWDYLASGPYTSTEKTGTTLLFGQSSTDAELTPEDRIIGALVQQCAREFVSRLVPCRIRVEAEIESSGNKNCSQGVQFLRAQAYDQALNSFQAAMAASGSDHRAAYGAGLASEALGQFDRALGYYRQALAIADRDEYTEARNRMNGYAGRAAKK